MMGKKTKKASRLAEIWRNFRRNRIAMIGLVILVMLLFVVIFADMIVDYDKGIAQNAAIRLQKPGPEHLFGTDAYGRDVFARVIHGSRTSLVIAVVVTMLSFLFGGVFGAVAGYYGGRVDDVIMRIMDNLSASRCCCWPWPWWPLWARARSI